jgi:hypothetical protein
MDYYHRLNADLNANLIRLVAKTINKGRVGVVETKERYIEVVIY